MSTVKLIQGNSTEVLKQYPDNHFDSIVTDPPYLIGFLGKDWDHSNNDLTEVFKECLRVLKPGGYLLSFSAARTYHKLKTMIEDAGFEIRDQIMWLYASGFPKSQDVGKSIQRRKGVEEYEGFVDTTLNAGFGQTDHARVRTGVEWSTKNKSVGIPKVTDEEAKQWSGWGSSLKPAHEPIVMARKPLMQTIAKNCIQYGTGAINIDACRIPFDNNKPQAGSRTKTFGDSIGSSGITGGEQDEDWEANIKGRFPSNVIGEIEGYQKFFYCPKVSRKERHAGFDKIPYQNNSTSGGMYGENQAVAKKNSSSEGNNHPTVKPVALMNYLIKLVTQPGGTVLDPFNGSGSTGMAAVQDGFNYVGIDLDQNYVDISIKRIAAWAELSKDKNTFNDIFE